jgi:hypothetical protein
MILLLLLACRNDAPHDPVVATCVASHLDPVSVAVGAPQVECDEWRFDCAPEPGLAPDACRVRYPDLAFVEAR